MFVGVCAAKAMRPFPIDRLVTHGELERNVGPRLKSIGTPYVDSFVERRAVLRNHNEDRLAI